MSLVSLQSLFFTKKIMDSYTVILPQKPSIMLPKSIRVYDSDSDSDDGIVVAAIVKEKKENAFVPTLHLPLPPPPPKRTRPFVPRMKDNLFWCFYIIVNGFSQYEYPGNNSFENEKADKFRLIEFLRKEENKIILKKHKIGKIKEDIEDELANKERIGVKTFLALCYTHKLNVLFIHRYKCFKIHGGHPDDKYHVVHQYDPPHQNSHGLFKYAYDDDATIEERAKYCDPTLFYVWETIEKPLKSISSYKVADLTQICRINNIDCKGKTKVAIYELLMASM